MALTKDEKQKLDNTHDAVIQIRTVLLGANGDDKGLCGEVKSLAISHYHLKKYFWILVAFLIGTGFISFSVLNIMGA